ncbi:hypothetical protein PFISCL1PPCAC_12981, partial [Pristionchus fissidentatus]
LQFFSAVCALCVTAEVINKKDAPVTDSEIATLDSLMAVKKRQAVSASNVETRVEGEEQREKRQIVTVIDQGTATLEKREASIRQLEEEDRVAGGLRIKKRSESSLLVDSERVISVYPGGEKDMKRDVDGRTVYDEPVELEGSGESGDELQKRQAIVAADDVVEGSGEVYKHYPKHSGLKNFLDVHGRNVRKARQAEPETNADALLLSQADPAPAELSIAQQVVLGVEEPVEEPAAAAALAVAPAMAQRRHDSSEERDRHRPRPDRDTCERVDCRSGMVCVMERGRPTCVSRPDTNTCATVDCRSGLICVMERGRPTCVPRPDGPSCATVRCIPGTTCQMENGRPTCVPDRERERTCRDINCPRDTRCRMERDPRCSGRSCPEQPVCVRDNSNSASCSRVQCPFGTRCRVVDEPGCFGRECREIATCVNSCDSVRCPVGTVCRADARGEPSCTPVVINPCLNARCPNGYQCQAVQNQARCIPIFTPPTTTTPSAPSSCRSQNEVFAICATFCEPNCLDKTPVCNGSCAPPRCQCAPGFFRNQLGDCVRAAQCEEPVQNCPANQVFTNCASACEPKCGQPQQSFCTLQCLPPQCQCMQGFFRHPNGSCVMHHQCFSG